jgi:hypothetical protein
MNAPKRPPRRASLPPETGLPVERKSGRFGPYIQLGEGKDAKRASIPKGRGQAGIFAAMRQIGAIAPDRGGDRLARFRVVADRWARTPKPGCRSSASRGGSAPISSWAKARTPSATGSPVSGSWPSVSGPVSSPAPSPP